VSSQQSSRVLQAADLDRICRELENMLIRASCDCSATGTGYNVKCYWHDQFCDEEGKCGCLSTSNNFGSDFSPVNGKSCVDFSDEMHLDFCASVTFCGDTQATLCGCEVEVAGDTTCDLCQVCSNVQGEQGLTIDCDNVMPELSTNGTCVLLDEEDTSTTASNLQQTNDGQCSSASSFRIAFLFAILVVVSALL
jgi:hypothetical protein